MVTAVSSKQIFGSVMAGGFHCSSGAPSFPGELEELQSVLHFPEEVALRITDSEYQLFHQVYELCTMQMTKNPELGFNFVREGPSC